jgi:ADP-heptose:LPS heptosyltransferase
MLCAVPALRAMRQTWPAAEITLIGLPGAAQFVDRFKAYVDQLMPFPGIPQFPEQPARTHELPGFYMCAQARRFDLAIQLHGSGQLVNAIVRRLGAGICAGFVPSLECERAGRFMAWPNALPEPLRYTSLMRFMGLPVTSDDLEFPLEACDQAEAAQLQRRLGFEAKRTVFVHPGARLPSRRWPLERFARVGQALAARGWRLAVTGSADERSLTCQLMAQLPAGCIDLTALTSLGSLAALLARSPLLLCNDTGVSHIAAAVGTPSVVVASGSDVDRWSPLDASRHAVLAFQVPCRPCAYHDCPIGHPCALGVHVDAVLAAALQKLDVSGAHAPCGQSNFEVTP